MFRYSLLLVPTILAVSTQVATADQSGHWVTMDPNAYFNGSLGLDQADVWPATQVPGEYEGQTNYWSYGGANGFVSPTGPSGNYSMNKVNVDNQAHNPHQNNWTTYFNTYYDTNGTADPSYSYTSTYSMNGNWDLGNNQNHNFNWGIDDANFQGFNLLGSEVAYITLSLTLYGPTPNTPFLWSNSIKFSSDNFAQWKDQGIRHAEFLQNWGTTSGRLTLDISIEGGTSEASLWPGNANRRAAVWVGIGENVMEIPAPGSLALLGLGGLFARRRRRQA